MAEKKILILHEDESNNELARALKRAFAFVDPDIDIDLKLFDDILNDIQLQPSHLLIVDSSSTSSSSLTPGFRFLRKYWTMLIENNKNYSPAILFPSVETIQLLIRRDARHIVGCAEGCEILPIPFCLKDVSDGIGKNAEKGINIETVKKYLRWSCELRMEEILEHAWKNFESPYSLLRGALCFNDITGKTFAHMKQELDQRGGREASEEFDIYDVAIKKKTDR